MASLGDRQLVTGAVPAIFTARYADFDASWGVAVSITRGPPRRFPHRYRRIGELAPTREMFAIDDRERFEALYRAHLDSVGAEFLAERFTAISAAHDHRPLVLLCYESLSEPGAWCHRIIAGRWITEHLDGQEEVAELGASGSR